VRAFWTGLAVVLVWAGAASSATLYVPSGYSTIQAAVNAAAPNDVIDIAAGTYEEQVEITKAVKLDGAGAGATTIKSPASLPLYFISSGTTSNYPVVYVHDATGVVIQELTVDGFDRGNANYRFVGIAFWNAGGTVSDVEVWNVMDSPFSGAQHGVGIYAYNNTGGPYDLDMTDVLVDDYQKTAVALLGEGLTVDLTRVTTVGAGDTDVTAQNGIQVGPYSGGTLTDCSSSGNSYTGAYWTASGFLFQLGSGIVVDGYSLDGNQTSIYLLDMDADIDDGTLTNPDGDAFYAFCTGGKSLVNGPKRHASPFDAEVKPASGKTTMTALFTNGVFTGADETNSAGPYAYASGGALDFTLDSCEMSHWDYGTIVYEDGGTITSSVANCSFHDNGSYGLYAEAAAEQDVEANWWGDASGPYNETTNPDGLGDAVSDYADYAPWLADEPGTSPMLWGTNGSIKEAIAAASSGDVIYVQPGTYVEAGQILINKNLTLVGVDEAKGKPVVMTDRNTGTSGDARGWWLVPAGNAVTIRNLILDGTGYNIMQGLRAQGTGTLDDCVIRNITHPGYNGLGVVIFDDWTVTGNVFSNIGRVGVIAFGTGVTGATISGNTYTGKGDGDWLDYGVELGGGAVATLVGNTITNCTGVASSDGSTSAGVLITTYYGAGTTGTLTSNRLTGNTTGIAVGYDEYDTSTVTANYNDFAGSEEYGIYSTGPAVGGTMNWWGAASGPSGEGGGSGVPVSEDVSFDPWIGKTGGENIVCDPDPLLLKVGSTTGQVAVKYLGGGSGLLFGYSMTVSWDAAKVSLTGVTEGGLLKDAAPTQFFVYGSGNTRTIDCSTLNGLVNPGVTGPGTMFTLNFSAVGYGESPVNLTIVAVRDRYNNPLSGFYEDDGLIKVDITNPSVTGVQIANLTLSHTDDYAKDTDDLELTATVSDDYPLTTADIKANLSLLLDGGGTAVPAEEFTGGVATWTLALADVDLTVPDGSKTVTVTVTDGLGNVGTGSDGIIVDNTLPGSVEGFAAAPGHQKVHLSWSNASGKDVNYYGVLVRYDAWGDYPEYDTAAPAYPGSPTAGDGEAFSGTGTTATHAIVPTDIHYYSAFVYDWALNYGPVTSGGQDRATNYWLGDVASAPAVWGYNGAVDVWDIDKLGGEYGQAPTGNYNRCDVGPTDDYSRLGIPLPDDFVGFEDLMMFALNYGVVSPAGKVVPFLTEPADGALALSLEELVAGPEGEVQVALRLGGNTNEVKGLSTAVTYDASELEFVSARLSDAMVSPLAEMFFWSGGQDGRVQVDLAVLGTGVTIGGSGDVAVLTFRALGGEYALGLTDALLRGVENEDLTAELSGLESTTTTPTAFRLSQNVPNPFNPRTVVAYEVPQVSEVTVRVYDVTGRLVRTLVDGTVEPGRYAVEWDGVSDAGESVGSGVYFCVMDAPAYHATHKMMLLK
jgi:hypothetical protein